MHAINEFMKHIQVIINWIWELNNCINIFFPNFLFFLLRQTSCPSCPSCPISLYLQLWPLRVVEISTRNCWKLLEITQHKTRANVPTRWWWGKHSAAACGMTRIQGTNSTSVAYKTIGVCTPWLRVTSVFHCSYVLCLLGVYDEHDYAKYALHN